VVDPTGRIIRLGEGSFATVYCYRNINTNEEVAIKRMKLTGLPMDGAELVIKYMPSE
jgi:serine/threonine protein kinase